MDAINDSNEYTSIDHPWLKKDDWLYLSIVIGSGDTIPVEEGDPPVPRLKEEQCRQRVMERC
ncbi:MAG: hypothetical protein M0Q38_06430 [Bacteroidales bacterium]|jgi:hypothetical protein|nr:hypothetical protein [Bacteroidales bacterium]